MLSLAFEPIHRVLLSRFSGAFTYDDITRSDKATLQTLGREGAARGILDFSAVDRVEVSAPQLRHRARQPPIAAGQKRIFVVTTPALAAIAWSYAALHQEFTGTELQVVETLDEAYDLLRLSDPRFEPMALP